MWLDACVLHQRTIFQSSQASNLLSFVAEESLRPYHAVEPGHLLHSAPTRPPNGNAEHLKSRYPFVLPAQQLISSSDDDDNISAAHWADHRWNAERSENTYKAPFFIPDIATHPTGMALLRTAWFRLNRFSAGVGRFRSCLYKWGTASSAACECGVEEQTVDHVILRCQNHQPPHGVNSLTVLVDEKIEWLLNTCRKLSRG